jgi:hypothetical protein
LLWRRSSNERLICFIEEVEKLLFRVAILGVVLLIVVQAFMTRDSFRYYLSRTEQLEGRLMENGVEAAAGNQISPLTTVTFTLRDYSAAPKVDLKVNGRTVANFFEREVTIAVNDEDLIELDGEFYTHSLVFVVKGTSGPVSYPETGAEFVVQNGVTAVGRVKLESDAAAP